MTGEAAWKKDGAISASSDSTSWTGSCWTSWKSTRPPGYLDWARAQIGRPGLGASAHPRGRRFRTLLPGQANQAAARTPLPGRCPRGSGSRAVGGDSGRIETTLRRQRQGFWIRLRPKPGPLRVRPRFLVERTLVRSGGINSALRSNLLTGSNPFPVTRLPSRRTARGTCA